MNILLVNDDGYNSEGILLLREKLLKYGRVVIVAPKEHMSCMSCSITINRPQKLTKVDQDLYYFDGTPADCVAFGMSSLGIKFDLVVSGCNDGWNISYDINYSATIGACTQALIYRIPTLAFSCEHNFNLVNKEFDNIFNYILNNKLLGNDYILNVNFPLSDSIKGIRLAHIFYREAKTFYIKSEDGYQASRQLNDSYKEDKNSDVYLVNHGYVSILPLGRTSFDKEVYLSLQNKMIEK